MLTKSDWDWEPGRKEIADIGQWQGRFNWVEEPAASPDGEKIAAVVNLAEGEFNVCLNGDLWETTFDKIWNLKFTPDGRLSALVSETGQWTVAVDGSAWENRFGYVWNSMFSPDGRNIAVAVQKDMAYAMALNDVVWEESFSNLKSFWPPVAIFIILLILPPIIPRPGSSPGILPPHSSTRATTPHRSEAAICA